MAGAERAVMEMLNDVGDNDSFKHAAQVFEGLTVLKPGVVNDLLAACRSIKVGSAIYLFVRDCPDVDRTDPASSIKM